MIFVDTNVLSEFGRRTPSERVVSWVAARSGTLRLSVVVSAELMAGVHLVRERRRRDALDASYAALLAGFEPPVALDNAAALTAAKLVGASRRAGTQLALADALIAATALRYDAPLATRNVKDFKATGLTLIDPWDAT